MLKNIENQTSSLGAGNKRNADQMLEPFEGSPVVSPSAETVNSDAPSDSENYALKKPRLSDERPTEKISPSKVLHIRSLPLETSEDDIMVLAKPYGQVTNMILMRNKRQAFVEMGDISQSISFYNSLQNPQTAAKIRGQSIQVQYSTTYTELQPGQRSHANGMKPTPVLHVNVDNHALPVTLNIMYQVFSRYGLVQKIITFSKNDQYQCLVQMANVSAAQLAKQHLDGKNVFPNCCTLRIDFSKMLSINIKYNNEKSRDFTNPHLPSGDDTMPLPHQRSAAAGGGHQRIPNAKMQRKSPNNIPLPQISVNPNTGHAHPPGPIGQLAHTAVPSVQPNVSAAHNLALVSYAHTPSRSNAGHLLTTSSPSSASLTGLTAAGYRLPTGAMVRLPQQHNPAAAMTAMDQLTLQQQIAAAQQLSALQQISAAQAAAAAHHPAAAGQPQPIMYRSPTAAMPAANPAAALAAAQLYPQAQTTSPHSANQLLHLQQLMASRMQPFASMQSALPGVYQAGGNGGAGDISTMTAGAAPGYTGNLKVCSQQN